MRLVVKEGLRNKVRALSEAMQHSGTPLLVLERPPESVGSPTCIFVNHGFERAIRVCQHPLRIKRASVIT